MKNDQVYEFLQNTGCPPHVVDGGLEGLIANWENVVDSIVAGYSLTLDDYLNDLDGRQLLEVALKVASHLDQLQFKARIEQADLKMKNATELTDQCLWGEEVAHEESWTPEKNWWYYRIPKQANDEFFEELG